MSGLYSAIRRMKQLFPQGVTTQHSITPRTCFADGPHFKIDGSSATCLHEKSGFLPIFLSILSGHKRCVSTISI